MKNILYILIVALIFISCEDKENNNIIGTGIDASTFGFLPTNNAQENVKALQKGLDLYNEIIVNTPGIYDLDSTIFINSNTKITFGDGVYIRKQRNQTTGRGADYVFINKGAYTNTYNENIEINGLSLICNKLDDITIDMIQGLVGQVSFFRVRNLKINNFHCIDLLPFRFCIQIAEFRNISIENAYIEGDKDGIHLGVGSDFSIRNCIFKTYDDPIALNAHDYDVSNPTVGWIENGLIENCYDLQDKHDTGLFCRILAGSWLDWYQGMKLQKSDIVVNNGRLYRVIEKNGASGKEYISNTAPTHTNGYQVIDGINWYMMQENVVYNAGCRNIKFKDIYLQKTREAVFSVHFDNDVWSRSYYPNSTAPIQKDLTFENIHIQTPPKYDIFHILTPIDNIKLINIIWDGGNIAFHDLQTEGLNYGDSRIILDNITFTPKSAIILTRNNRKVTAEIKNSKIKDIENYSLPLYGNVSILSSDIPYYYIED